jgi:hypothetical protein
MEPSGVDIICSVYTSSWEGRRIMSYLIDEIRLVGFDLAFVLNLSHNWTASADELN